MCSPLRHIWSVLNSALKGGEWSASRHGRFTPRGNCPCYTLKRIMGELGLSVEEKYLLFQPRIERPFLGCPAIMQSIHRLQLQLGYLQRDGNSRKTLPQCVRKITPHGAVKYSDSIAHSPNKSV